MPISTKRTSVSPEERKKRIAELREYHQPYFDKIGEPRARFIAKMLYGWPPDRCNFFENEISNSTPLYVEWVTRGYFPEDERRLYKYIYNPDYATDYVKEVKDDGLEMYVVPIDKFELVKDGEPVKVDAPEQEPKQAKLELDFDIVITLRDWAAILLKAPVSRKEWLNKLIKDSCQK
jgi:hypothetical protein